jgi:hypothetical protein
MRTWTRHIIILGVLIILAAGCEEFLLGAGAGVAGQETLQSWQENLDAKKAELAEQYDLVMAELESAPDPDAVAVAKQKLQAIQDAQLANEGAMLAVKTALELPKQETTEGRQDVIASAVIGTLILGWQALNKRKLNLKYTAIKAGKAKFDADNPEAAPKLFSAIGIERTKRGL